MIDMKCPFCQQKLVYDSGIEQWCCDKCHLSGGYKLWKVLINTRKALDIAVDALKYANKCIKGGCINWETEIDRALNKITALTEGSDND